MSKGWENYESSPVEYMHGQLLEEFHFFRLNSKDGQISVLMNSSELNEIIVKVKKKVYEKFKSLDLDKPVLKNK